MASELLAGLTCSHVALRLAANDVGSAGAQGKGLPLHTARGVFLGIMNSPVHVQVPVQRLPKPVFVGVVVPRQSRDPSLPLYPVVEVIHKYLVGGHGRQLQRVAVLWPELTTKYGPHATGHEFPHVVVHVVEFADLLRSLPLITTNQLWRTAVVCVTYQPLTAATNVVEGDSDR